MGRTARNYPKGRLKLRTPKVVQSDKRYPIYIVYNWNADSMRKTTEVSVFAKDWNENGYSRIGEIRTTTNGDKAVIKQVNQRAWQSAIVLFILLLLIALMIWLLISFGSYLYSLLTSIF